MFDNKLHINLYNYCLVDDDGLNIKNSMFNTLKDKCFNELGQDDKSFILYLGDEIKGVISDFEVILEALKPYELG